MKFSEYMDYICILYRLGSFFFWIILFDPLNFTGIITTVGIIIL